MIIARAGELGAVTVATNMAGRGVDIRLGGELKDETIREAQALLRRRGLDPFRVSDDQFYTAIAEVDPEHVRRRNKVLALGGLHVLGTERHDARRIDNQLRGRAGRQGEPGSSRFYVSLEDDMMRVFATGAMNWVMGKAFPDDMPLEAKMVTKAIEHAQRTVEDRDFRDPQGRPQVRRGHERAAEGDLPPPPADPRRWRPAATRRTGPRSPATIERTVLVNCPDEFPEDWDLDELHLQISANYPTRITANS